MWALWNHKDDSYRTEQSTLKVVRKESKVHMWKVITDFQYMIINWAALPGDKWSGDEKAESGSLYCPFASAPSPRLFAHEPTIETYDYKVFA